MPKSASTTIANTIARLSWRNGFAPNRRETKEFATRDVVAYLGAFRRRAAHIAHGEYFDFSRGAIAASAPALRARRPAWVGVLRDPVSRMRSSYDYSHFTEKKWWTEHIAGKPPTPGAGLTWQQCVAATMDGTDASDCLKLRSRAVDGLKYYCGNEHDYCARDGDAGFGASLALARENVARDFVAVGVVEQLDAAFAVWERVLPSYFRGLRRAAATIGDQRPSTHPGRALNASEDAWLRAQPEVAAEAELYAWILRVFEAQAAACGVATKSTANDENATAATARAAAAPLPSDAPPPGATAAFVALALLGGVLCLASCAPVTNMRRRCRQAAAPPPAAPTEVELATRSLLSEPPTREAEE